MEYKFEYDRTRLSLTRLQESGIRSATGLEEVIEWEFSVCKESSGFDFPLYRFLGLTRGCLGLEVAVTFDHSGRFVLLDAMVLDRNELLKVLIANRK